MEIYITLARNKLFYLLSKLCSEVACSPLISVWKSLKEFRGIKSGSPKTKTKWIIIKLEIWSEFLNAKTIMANTNST